jgi:hypothetical protein
VNEGIHEGRTASELRDRVAELIEQQTAVSEVLRAIANSPHELQPIFDAILDSATRLCRADIGGLRLSEESGLRRVAMRGDPVLVSQALSSFPVLRKWLAHAGWESWKTLVLVWAYHSFCGGVEALNTLHDTPDYPLMPSPIFA